MNTANGKTTKGPSYSVYSLFDMATVECLTNGAVLASCTPSFEQDLYGHSELQEERESLPVTLDLTVPSKMACSVCAAEFSSRADQIQHYKLDWHRFNLKERLKGNAPITEMEFDEKSGDMSSLSGSDSGSESRTSSDVPSSPRHKPRPSAVPEYLRIAHEQPSKLAENSSETDDTDDVPPKRTRMQPKVYFQNDNGKIIGLYRCVIHSKQNSPTTKDTLVAMLNRIPEESTWAVILVGGGHFAAGIFECLTVLEHKTFHRYTVRAKQGGSQGSKDGRQGGHFNSAGASLRRHNESALAKDIQDLLSVWYSKLQVCHRIFYRAASFNRSVLFGGKNPPFKKDDPRLRTIPFPTRRATYSEVKRVHHVLSTLECFGDAASYRESLPVSPKMHLGTKKKKSLPCSDDVIPTLDSNKFSKSSVSSSMTNTENKDERNNSCAVECPENTVSLLGNESLPHMEEQLESRLSSLSTDPAGAELDGAGFIGSEEKSTCDVSDMKVPLPPKKKKGKHKASTLLKRQKDPDADATAGEKYQMKNSLYDACKAGNLDGVQKLLDIIVCSQVSFTPLNPEGSSCSVMQSHSKDIAVEASPDLCVLTSDRADLSEDVGASVNMPLGHVSTNSRVADIPLSSNHSDIDAVTVSDIPPSVSSLEKVTSSDNGAAHPRRSSVPSPRLQQNKNQRSHSMSSKDDSALAPSSVTILNEKINEEGTTLLHVATKEGYHSIVRALLDNGADPTVRNRKGLAPYMVSSDKEMRNVYRRFMASHPELYDYNKAQIPSPLTEAQEAEKLEKSKEKKKLRKARMKEKKKEEEEKQRFLSLSDREKCATMAERRRVQQFSFESSQVRHEALSRCFSCAEDLTGKTPFEYLNFVFCCMACVKKHRAKFSS